MDITEQVTRVRQTETTEYKCESRMTTSSHHFSSEKRWSRLHSRESTPQHPDSGQVHADAVSRSVPLDQDLQRSACSG
jgi:hypothetical protein